MPATIEMLADEALRERVAALARTIRQRRKALGVTVVAAAEAAGMSRVTWHRIEQGEVTVTIGAWFNALAVLGLQFGLGETRPPDEQDEAPGKTCVPVEIRLQDYPQLRALAWQVASGGTVHPREALDIYQRNRRHIDWDSMKLHERRLFEALTTLFGAAGSV